MLDTIKTQFMYCHSTEDGTVFATPTGDAAHYVRATRGLCGAVGLFLLRRQYRNAYARWITEANSWYCGEQDRFGEGMDDLVAQIRELGGGEDLIRADRRLVEAQCR